MNERRVVGQSSQSRSPIVYIYLRIDGIVDCHACRWNERLLFGVVPDRVCFERCSCVRLRFSILRTTLEVWSTISYRGGGLPSRTITGCICIDGAIVSAAASVTSVRTVGSEVVEEDHLVITA